MAFASFCEQVTTLAISFGGKNSQDSKSETIFEDEKAKGLPWQMTFSSEMDGRLVASNTLAQAVKAGKAISMDVLKSSNKGSNDLSTTALEKKPVPTPSVADKADSKAGISPTSNVTLRNEAHSKIPVAAVADVKEKKQAKVSRALDIDPTLQLSESASIDEIRDVWKKLRAEPFPDNFPNKRELQTSSYGITYYLKRGNYTYACTFIRVPISDAAIQLFKKFNAATIAKCTDIQSLAGAILKELSIVHSIRFSPQDLVVAPDYFPSVVKYSLLLRVLEKAHEDGEIKPSSIATIDAFVKEINQRVRGSLTEKALQRLIQLVPEQVQQHSFVSAAARETDAAAAATRVFNPEPSRDSALQAPQRLANESRGKQEPGEGSAEVVKAGPIKPVASISFTSAAT